MAPQNGNSTHQTLPPGDSPTLTLIPANASQAQACQVLNSVAWRGPLTQSAYLRRESHLASQPLTQHGGITHWILIDSSPSGEPAADPRILASCETYRKRAFVSRRSQPGAIQEITSHGIGSVFCRDEFRGKGYAGRMMEELAAKLKTWQQGDGQQALFNVLYSDIGKKFYARRGWVPFPSSHVALPALREGEGVERVLPETRELKPEDLPALCEVDVQQLRRTMGRFEKGTDASVKVKVAFVPDVETMQWQHSREEFLAQELYQRIPEVKGAMIGTESGERVWCVWTRVFASKPEEATLHVTRLVVEERPDIVSVEPMGKTNGVNGGHAVNGRNGVNGSHGTNGVNDSSSTAGKPSKVDAIAACLRAAQLEAARWNLGQVEIWNPAAMTMQAAAALRPDVKVLHREEESIASLLWYGSEVQPSELEWVGNEKYGWC